MNTDSNEPSGGPAAPDIIKELALAPGDLLPAALMLLEAGYDINTAVAGPAFGAMSVSETLFKGMSLMPHDLVSLIAKMAVLASAASAPEDAPEEARTPSAVAQALAEGFSKVEEHVDFEDMRIRMRDVKAAVAEVDELEAAFNAPALGETEEPAPEPEEDAPDA